MICHSDPWTSRGILKLSEEKQNIEENLNKFMLFSLATPEYTNVQSNTIKVAANIILYSFHL